MAHTSVGRQVSALESGKSVFLCQGGTVNVDSDLGPHCHDHEAEAKGPKKRLHASIGHRDDPSHARFRSVPFRVGPDDTVRFPVRHSSLCMTRHDDDSSQRVRTSLPTLCRAVYTSTSLPTSSGGRGGPATNGWMNWRVSGAAN